MDRRLFAVGVLGLVTLASGCSLSDGGYKAGELGNGGFYFSCNDAVACTRYSNDASKFPQVVSLGSTFDVRFVSKTTDADTHITFNEKAPDRGITINPVGEYISRGPTGLVALKSGFGTITSRDAAGQLVDFVNIRVAKPDALVVYAAEDASETPARIETVTLVKTDRRTYRAFAQEKKAVLAGTLAIEWKSSNSAIVDVESTSEGKATIVARAAGSAKLIATGGTFTQEISVEVKP